MQFVRCGRQSTLRSNEAFSVCVQLSSLPLKTHWRKRRLQNPAYIHASVLSRFSACSEFFLCGTFTFPSFERERLRPVAAEQ